MADKAILVIDSDSDTAEDIVATLEPEDYLVFTSSTAEFAVAMARRVRPALILINPAMAGASGLDICMKLHAMEEVSSVPIIALASFEGEMDPRYRLDYGIVDLLRKPFTREELLAKITCALSMQPLDTGEGHAPPKPPTPEEIPGERAGGSNRIDRIVVRLKEKREEKEEKTEKAQIAEEGSAAPEQPAETEGFVEEQDKRTFVPRKPLRMRRSPGSRLTVPLIAAVLLVILVAAGAVVYKMGVIPGAGVKKPMAVNPPQPVQKEPVEVPSPPEQKPPQDAVPEKAQLPVAVSPPPAVQVPEKRPAGKVIYSIQIGAFKNEKNAGVLAKQFKEKGYDAFVETVPKDKETLYRVLIGKFENRKEAGRLAGEIVDKEKVKAIVTGD
jgi:DNA-binding response OmpR family regulator